MVFKKTAIVYLALGMMVGLPNSISLACKEKSNSDSLLSKDSRKKILTTYKVPVKDSRLETFSQFSMSVKVRTVGTVEEFEYELPLELTGESVEISITGLNDKFSGDLSAGECKLQETGRVCQMNYNKNLPLVKEKVDSYLRAQNFSPEELSARLQVADSFMLDPVGFIQFPKAK